MPLTLKYLANDGTTTVSGKSTTLDDDAKTRRAIDLLCEAYLGKEAADVMKSEDKATYVAELMAVELRNRARMYRNEQAMQAAQVVADAQTDL